MPHDPSRAALVAVSVLTVLLAASLFPAAGFGRYPGSVGGAAGPSDPGVAPQEGPGATDAPATSVRTTTEQTRTAATTADPGTDTETATPTHTSTGAAADTPDRGGGFPIVSFLVQLVSLFAVCAAVALLLVTVGDVERRRTDEFDGYVVDVPGLPTFRVRASVLAIPQRTMATLVGLSAAAPRALDGIGRTARGLLAGVDGLADGLSSAAVALPSGLARGLAAVPRGLAGGLSSLSLGLSAFTGASGWLTRDDDKPDDPRDAADDDDAPADESDPGPVSIDEAWAALVAYAPVRRPRSSTPAEVARAAVDGGLPRSAVERLTAVFRDVRYGRYPRTDDRKRVAREALDEIRDRMEGDR